MKKLTKETSQVTHKSTHTESLNAFHPEAQIVVEWEKNILRYLADEAWKQQDQIASELRQLLTRFIANNFSEILSRWQKLGQDDRLTFYRDVMLKIYPDLIQPDLPF